MLKKIRSFLHSIIKFLVAHVGPVRLLYKTYRSLRDHGVKFTMEKIRLTLRNEFRMRMPIKAELYTRGELRRQRKEAFPAKLTFSIIVPLYNTPEKFLREMLESVKKQTYPHWELCLADGSDDAHREVGRIAGKYAARDTRIRYRKLEKNLGISGNTNAALEMAQGDYIALLDHDDVLHPAALYVVAHAIQRENADFVYTDEGTFRGKTKNVYLPHFKPDYAPDTLRGNNYICHFTVFRRKLLEITGGFRPECDGSQDYDMVLRLTEQTKRIVHIPQLLYYWRAHAGSTAQDAGIKPYVTEAGRLALRDHLARIGLEGEVMDTAQPSIYRIRYALKGTPLVSVIIPNRDHAEDLKKCLSSILEKTSYPNWEIILVENGSTEAETWAYYEKLKSDERIRIVTWDGGFNYSAINNYAAGFARGEYLLLLNNDTEVISAEWIEEMLMFAQREDVGAVGAKLYYPDDTVQHAGVGIGLMSLAAHLHRGWDRRATGYMGRLIYAQNLSAVTGACMMIPKRVWEQVEGLDESFAVAFNDVDLCMRIRKAGYLIAFTPFAELYHYESKSRGNDFAPENFERFQSEVARCTSRWEKELHAGDPYYNPNFDPDRADFSYDVPFRAVERIRAREGKQA